MMRFAKNRNLSPVIRDETSNNLDAYIPEYWAYESIAILRENMVIANLIHRDFSEMVANAGDVVNTRKPAEYVAKRKGLNDAVTVQESTATNVAVPLNQHIHVSFLLRDGEMAKSMKQLVPEYLSPALLAEARGLDKIILGECVQWLASNSYMAGSFGGLTSTTAVSNILAGRQLMNVNKAPSGMGDRNIIWTPYSETSVLANEVFHSAEKVGDSGTALREANLGRKLGFDHYMGQNTGYVDSAGTVDTATAAVNLTAGYAAGYSGSIAIDGAAYDLAVGTFVTIAGDNRPRWVTARTYSSPNTTAITLNTPLSSAVLNDAVITVYKAAAANLTAGYAAGYDGYLALDGFTSGKFMQVGQPVAFGTTAGTRHTYTVIDVQNASGTAQEIQLNRPLDTAVSNNDPVFPGPAGNYNFMFNRNAIALVTRPLPNPMVPGVISQVVNAGGFSVRVVITYDGNKQGHLVTVDFLCGIKVLDLALGGVLLG